jgi:hypothetical protein
MSFCSINKKFHSGFGRQNANKSPTLDKFIIKYKQTKEKIYWKGVKNKNKNANKQKHWKGAKQTTNDFGMKFNLWWIIIQSVDH